MFNIDPLGLAGGPYHSPIATRCQESDSCSTLKGKMYEFLRMINSHQGWDWNNPPPRGGNRHAEEIADLWRGFARCQDIYNRKQCDKCDDEGKNCQTVIAPETVAAGVGAGIGFGYIIWKLVKVCVCTFAAGPAGGAICAATP